MKFAWIDEMGDEKADADHNELWWFSVALACEVLEVSTSGFYDWRARCDAPPTPREREQAQLLAEIRTIHKASKGAYGSPRVYAELRDSGWVLGENRVARLMAAHGIQGRSGRKPGPRTTRPAKVAPDVPDLVERDFASIATAPDRLWCSDLTYVPTAQGWLYLTIILDACSRAIVGWAAADHMRTSLIPTRWRSRSAAASRVRGSLFIAIADLNTHGCGSSGGTRWGGQRGVGACSRAVGRCGWAPGDPEGLIGAG